MSIGIHIGLASQGPQLKNSVLEYLSTSSLEGYSEPVSPSSSPFYVKFGASGYQCLGRSALDHNAATQFAELGAAAEAALGSEALALAPLAKLDRPYVVLPVNLPTGLQTTSFYLVSSQDVVTTLLAMAPSIGIAASSQGISDSQADAINEGEGDVAHIDLQTVWLTLHEAARLSLLNSTSVVLA